MTLRDSTFWPAVANADGSGQRMLTRTSAGNLAPAWSPDGRKIAFVGRLDRLAWPPPEPYPAGRHNFEIYVINADGSGLRRLTRNTVADTFLVSSPDGRRIAFESNWQVWVAERGRQRRATADEQRGSQLRPFLVAQRAEDRVRAQGRTKEVRLLQRVQPSVELPSLGHECGWQRGADAGTRWVTAFLVARWAEDRV